MNTFYLVDFENVGNEGMKGCESLTPDDCIYLFYTENVKSIDVNIVGNHGGAKFYVLKVPVRKQSTDMHLVSFLGYLIGINKIGENRYVIISKDNDYDNVIQFWREKKKADIMRIGKISDIKKKNVNNKTSVVKKQSSDSQAQAQNIKANNKKINNQTSDAKKRNKLNVELQQELKKAKVSAEVMGFVTSNVIKNIDAEDKKNTVYKILVSKYGQESGSELYKRIKKLL
ncbi:MAG: PIN domain-containing protein [Bacteroides sp.]|nr:PIN domain-containing protein [Bacteroides sp.]